jgi:rhodanese-related sulfurtransferase
MKNIQKEELKKRLENNSTTLIEVLNPEEYEKEHIRGAINIPLSEIATEANKSFKKDQELILYCSDADCTASATAAEKLEDTGFTNIYHYPGGKKEWKEAGFPME